MEIFPAFSGRRVMLQIIDIGNYTRSKSMGNAKDLEKFQETFMNRRNILRFLQDTGRY